MKILSYEVNELTTRPSSNSYVLYAVTEFNKHVIAEFINKTPSREDLDLAIHYWKRGFLVASSMLSNARLNAPLSMSAINNNLAFRVPVSHATENKVIRRGPVTNGPKSKSISAEEPESPLKFRKSKF